MQGVELLSEHFHEVVSRYWQRLTEHPEFTDDLRQLLEQDAEFSSELMRVWVGSDFAANSIVTHPTLLKTLHARRHEVAPEYLERLLTHLGSVGEQDYKTGAEGLKQALRIFHRTEYLLILWRDICALLDVHGVCRQMSDLADATLEVTLRKLHEWSCAEWGEPRNGGHPQTLVVIGMGKLGARELNVSSDIDLIFAYPQPGEVSVEGSTEPLTHQQFFTRLGQRLIDALDTTTPEGFVFRVDMRLRPYGSEGALVASFDAMEDYYQSQGRDWERYALIKARIVAGDQEQGNELLQRLKPFVYRRYLDFAMFESLRNMKSQINRQARRGKLATDIKLGSGGIREIEFTVQALQLVYGGRDRSLRTASIVAALDALVAGEHLPEETARDLLKAYEFLRSLEHKLQLFTNQQTQSLPTDPSQQRRIAQTMGFENWAALVECLDGNRRTVAEHFREVLGTEQEIEETLRLGDDWAPLWKQDLGEEEAIGILTDAGYEKPGESLTLLQEFRREKKFLTLPAESRERLNVFMPVLLDAVAESDKPSLCLKRLMRLVDAVCRRTAYLVLLLENPQALKQLVQYCTTSPLIADYLCKYPVLLDELLDVLDVPPDKITLADELKMQLLRVEEENFEEELNCLRYFKQSHLLQVAAAEVSGKMHLMKVSDYLTFTAEVILDAVLALSWQHLVERHGYPVHTDGKYGEPNFGIIGYGKLGGLELSYNSDLDLVFLHQAAIDEDTVASEGQVAINSRAFYIKLAQRIIVMLGTVTMSGKLYEADMRLRPSGDSGLLVSSIEAFHDYQKNQAWTWEHQALVRARGVAGNRDLLQRFMQVRNEVLAAERDVSKLAAEVVTMREKMRKELKESSRGALGKLAFEIKQGSGGIVDIEFLVQYLVLAYAHNHPDLLTYTDNYRILEVARDCHLLEDREMNTLINAYLDLRTASHRVALQQEDEQGLLKETGQLTIHREAVSRVWAKIFPATQRDGAAEVPPR